MLRERIAATLVSVVTAMGWMAFVTASAHGAEGWAWPVTGEVITRYHNGSDPYAGGQHRGIDVAAAAGTPVVAAASGAVRFAGLAGSSGLTVSIRTFDGRFDTSYLHLASAAVRDGDRVERGSTIGAVGVSGRRSVSAPHLHFGVREAGSRHAYRDPLDFLPPLTPRRVPDAPRGGPLPVGAPVRVRPLRAPVRRPSPARRPAAQRRPVRVPAARRIRVPVGSRLPRILPRLRPAPMAASRPLGAPHASAPAPNAVPAPGLGPGPLPAPRPQALPDGSRRPAARAPEPGLDLGWALACAGLLLAAACLGRPGGGRAERRSGGYALLSRLRPLLGRR